VVLAAAVALAGVGGSVAGLGAPVWLAGTAGAVSALVAGVMADRGYGAREERAAARERRKLALDDLRPPVPEGRGDVLGLLQAGRSPVPFRSRTRELAQLAAWRDDAGCPVRILGGPGGVGKTRLAAEFGLRAPEGWAAGWLHAGAGGTVVDAVRACGDPALILVDDADGRQDLPSLLESLAVQPAEPAIRVVLVTRSPEALRAALARRLEERHAWVASEAETLELEAAGGPDDWARWYEEAVAAFAAALKRPVPPFLQRFTQSPAEAVTPFVVMQAQALLAVLEAGTGERDPRDPSFGQVAGALMDHEQRWWRAVAARWDWGGSPPALAVQERCLTALALLGADDAAEAGRVLRRVPELIDAPAERMSAIASWLLALYPAGNSLAPRIRPDLIGDWFVVTRLAADPDLARSLRTGLTDDQAARALALLARAADTAGEAARLFSEFAVGSIRRSILAAVQAASAGRAGRRLLDSVIAAELPQAGQWTPEQITEITDLIPDYLLLQTHVVLSTLAVNAYRQLAADNPAAHQPRLAMALNNLGTMLRAVGRHRDALAATEEAVTLYRQLAADNPAAHQPDRAMALNNLGAMLSAVGRDREALAATEEAVTLRRQLAADDPAAHQPDLAGALTNLGNKLSAVGRDRDALAPAEEAVTLRRQLAADDPAAHQPYLAAALTNLGSMLRAVGSDREALAATEEAVTLYRQLAVDNPAAHQPDRAMALTSLGAMLSAVGRDRDALAAAEEAVTLYRQLAVDNPAAHQPNRAMALNNLGEMLRAVGRDRDALAATEEAVTLYRQLAVDNPAAHQPYLAGALTNLGNKLSAVGRDRDALAATEEAVTLYRQLAADNPAAHQPNLATALTNLGKMLDQGGSGNEMLALQAEAVSIYRDLAERDPDLYQAEYKRQLGALQREYDHRGMSSEAITRDLPPRTNQRPKAPNGEDPNPNPEPAPRLLFRCCTDAVRGRAPGARRPSQRTVATLPADDSRVALGGGHGTPLDAPPAGLARLAAVCHRFLLRFAGGRLAVAAVVCFLARLGVGFRVAAAAARTARIAAMPLTMAPMPAPSVPSADITTHGSACGDCAPLDSPLVSVSGVATKIRTKIRARPASTIAIRRRNRARRLHTWAASTGLASG
jgi:tetratricopeptide (TPR) repeat protein